ncbi:MAG: DUF547 domain-containing protein, partial [Chloroflexota bacterium]
SLEVVEEIKTAINGFKSEAIDQSGYHIDYSKLKNTPAYHKYIGQIIPKLRTMDVTKLTDPKVATAFWINLYNALVIHAVIEFGITKSLMSGGPQNYVRFFRRAAYRVNGQRFSLDDIEHGVLRGNRGNPSYFTPQFSSNDMRQVCVIEPVDPRIHFALNCASQSCPPINLYAGENLDQQLDMAAGNFMQHEVKWNRGTLWLSMIFKWYGRDFGTEENMLDLIKDYLKEDPQHAEWISNKQTSVQIKYSPNNWGLNL